MEKGMDPVLLDSIIGRLLEVKTLKPGKNAQLSESEIKQLCAASKEIFLSQPNLLELEAPIKICGNLPRFLRLFLDGCRLPLEMQSRGIGFAGQRVVGGWFLDFFGWSYTRSFGRLPGSCGVPSLDGPVADCNRDLLN
jgi:hypothetical protein